MKSKMALIVMALTALSLSACKPKSETSYESTEKAVDANGTETKTETSADVTTDSEGKTEGTVETTTTTDPEGMMNKETTTEKHEVQQ